MEEKNNLAGSTFSYKPPKDEADNYLKLSIFHLYRKGCLTNGNSGSITYTYPSYESKINYSTYIDFIYQESSCIRLKYEDYDFNENKVHADFNIYLTTTPCTYGGERYWFVCPAVVNGKSCNRRVGVLYKPKYGCPYFACRHCYNLTYESSNLSGEMKKYGKTLSIPEIRDLESKVRKKHYKGKITKKHLKFLIKLEQFDSYHKAWYNKFMKKYIKG